MSNKETLIQYIEKLDDYRIRVVLAFVKRIVENH